METGPVESRNFCAHVAEDDWNSAMMWLQYAFYEDTCETATGKTPAECAGIAFDLLNCEEGPELDVARAHTALHSAQCELSESRGGVGFSFPVFVGEVENK